MALRLLVYALLVTVIVAQAALILGIIRMQLSAGGEQPTVAVEVTADAATRKVPKHLSLISELDPNHAAKIWPEEQRAEAVCGTDWQDAYAALHARLVEEGTSKRIVEDGIMKRTEAKPVRIAMFDCRVGQGGYADRLIGLMTVLLISIITDRALVINWPTHEDALRFPRIQTTALLRQAETASKRDRREFRWLQQNRLDLAKLTDVDLNEEWVRRHPDTAAPSPAV